MRSGKFIICASCQLIHNLYETEIYIPINEFKVKLQESVKAFEKPHQNKVEKSPINESYRPIRVKIVDLLFTLGEQLNQRNNTI